jgi:type IV pilus assembly protein PilO
VRYPRRAAVAIDVDTILKLPTQKKMLILAGIIGILAFLYFYLLYFPQYKKYTELQSEVQKLSSDLEEQKKVAATLPKFKKEAQELEQMFTTALKELPDKKEIPSLLMNISQMAQESGLQITLFQPQKENVMNFYEEIPVKIKLSGGYHEFALFFDKVANLSRIVNIKDLAISEANIYGDKVNLNSSCTAITFRFIEKSQAAPKAKKAKKVKKPIAEEKIT